MTFPFGATSILEQKASRLNVSLEMADVNTRLGIYLGTLSDIEYFLDTEDLGVLTERSISVLIDDVLKIIDALRSIQPTNPKIKPVLDELRNARDALQIAKGYIKNEDLKNPTKYYAALSSCRSSLHDTLQYAQGLAGNSTTPAPPPDVSKKKKKGK